MQPISGLNKWRKAIAALFAVFFVMVLVSENLPTSETRTSLNWIDEGTRAFALEQGWGVFAPIPASLEVSTHAIATLSDGREVRWEPPSGNLFTGTARFERWRKWSTRIRTGDSEHLWEVNAWRIAEDIHEETGVEPVSVDLWRRWSKALPPGEGFDRNYSEFMFYRYDPGTGEGAPTSPDDEDGDRLVLDLDEELPPLDEINDPVGLLVEGELPNPEDPPSAPPTPAPLDAAQTTTQQIDPVDKSAPPQLPFAESQDEPDQERADDG